MLYEVITPLELLEDHFVHLAAGVNQRRSENRQRTAFLDLAGSAEETFGTLQGVGVDASYNFV